MRYYDADLYRKHYIYDAVNVNRVQDIPMDYEGPMCVPVEFLDHQVSSQYDIIGEAENNKVLLQRRAR